MFGINKKKIKFNSDLIFPIGAALLAGFIIYKSGIFGTPYEVKWKRYVKANVADLNFDIPEDISEDKNAYLLEDEDD